MDRPISPYRQRREDEERQTPFVIAVSVVVIAFLIVATARTFGYI